MSALAAAVIAAGLGGCGRAGPDGSATATTATRVGGGTEAALAAAVAIRATGCRPAEASTGAGTVVGDGLVVTVAHVVAGSDRVSVIDAAGTDHPATVVAFDPGADLAVLAVDGLDATPLPLGGPALAAGDPGVFVIHDGDGRARPQPARVTRRADLSTADIYGRGTHVRPGFELEAEVRPGDSGAAVVTHDGRAGAVVFATGRDGTSPPGQAWATDVAAVAPLLAGPLDRPVPTGACVN